MLLAAALVFSLQFKPVQTYVAKKAAKYLSKELHTTIEIKSLFIKPFKSIVLEGLYIQDLSKDTLFYSQQFAIDLNTLSLKNRKISVNTAEMNDGVFYLKDLKDTTTNLDFIINYFDTGEPKPKVKSTKKPYDITFDNIILNNFAFRYKNLRVDTTVNGINYDDISLRNMNLRLSGLDTKEHLVRAKIEKLSFKEKSGFYLQNLTALATIDTNQMEFKNLQLVTPQTHLTDYVKLSYENALKTSTTLSER